MSEKKSKLPLILVLLLIVAGAIGFYVFQKNKDMNEASGETVAAITESNTQEEPVKSAKETITEEVSNTSEEMIEKPSSTDMGVETASIEIDVAKALTERSIGSADAPVTIREHSSFTCGHCGDFHRNTYAQLKSEYIDTGKVRLVFTDFPLNGAALHASMISRCLPEDRYFDFVDLLFKTQDKWAYDATYITYLRQNAALAGLSSEEFDACIRNDELKQGITDAMRAAQQKYNVSSTPTFVFNEDNVMSGARNFEFYKDVIEKELSEAAE